jgi:transcription antitermination protein NusB
VRRSEQRRAAVFALYQHDLTGRPLEDTLPRDVAPFTRALAQAALARQAELDELIGRHAEGWALERIAPLERSIMRVGLLELLHPGDVPAERPIPPEGAIDEAVETAKAYCGADAPGFVNGIMAAVLRAQQEEEPAHSAVVRGRPEAGRPDPDAGLDAPRR